MTLASHIRAPLVALLVIALAGVGAPLAAAAAETRADEVVHIQADETIAGDLYAFGRDVIVEGTIQGDLIAFGSKIEIKGNVEGDVAAAGQTILIESLLSDDARLAGQVIKLARSAQVKGDLVAAGLSLELETGSQVSGDLLFAGYQADLSGDIGGNVRGGLANARLAGKVGGDVNLEVGSDGENVPPQAFGPPPPLPMPSVPPGLTVASTATLEGELQYTGGLEASIEEGATLANPAKFTKQLPAQAAAPPTATEIVLGHVRHFACVALLGAAMLLLAPSWSTTLADNVRRRPLASFVGGLLGLIAFVVLLLAIAVGFTILAIVAATATLGEVAAVSIVVGLLSFAGLIGGFWLFTSYLAPVIAGLALGRVATSLLASPQIWLAFAIGLVAFALLCAIPYAGPWIGFGGMLLALGALGLWLISSPTPAAAATAAAGPVKAA